jgi:hypothetical protein
MQPGDERRTMVRTQVRMQHRNRLTVAEGSRAITAARFGPGIFSLGNGVKEL